MKKIVIFLLIILLLIAAGYGLASSINQPPQGIILISLDTLRADHLGIYGYHRNTSPFIDAFAKESVVFENAVVQSQWTLPSHASIMTSLYPSSHGVTEIKDSLSEEHVTLAELLRREGYATGAFTDGAFLRKRFGLNQGFDLYDGERRVGIKEILPKVKKWLEEHKSTPFFLFIHCYDIHAPYDPPPPYDSIFQDFTYTGNLSPSTETIWSATWEGLKINDEDARYFMALYDGGIRYTDEKIGELLSYLRDSGLEKQSLIIITSDHGDEFLEHGRLGHQQLYYRPNLHVPLIVRVPGLPKKEIRIRELVQSIDLMPTILELAGLPVHPNVQGRSLLPLMKRYKNVFNRSLAKVFQSFVKDSQLSYSMEPRFKLYSIITEGYQLIYNMDANSIKLFNLERDPLAQNNIAKHQDDTVQQLLEDLKNFNAVKPDSKAPGMFLDEQTREQLEALGYIGNASIAEDDDDFDGVRNVVDNCPNVSKS